MLPRLRLIFALIAAYASLGASYRTPNFVVHAPDQQTAQSVGQWAEHYRRDKALQWLGQEMPPWPQPCPLHVKVTMSGPSGATTFNFGQGRVLEQEMQIQGPLDRLIASVLPHEITHTVFAHYFRCPVPRWADEGGSVLSEDDVERERHDKIVRSILNQNRQIPLRRLVGLKEYPRDVVCLYAQGYSLSNYLVDRSSRHTFLQFVAHGMHHGWDTACRAYYKHNSVEELEEAWLRHLRDTKGQPHIQLARNGAASQPVQGAQTGQTVVRLTVPADQQTAQQPRQEPLFRGQSPGQGDPNQRPAAPYNPVPVTLGPPQFGPPPAPGFPRQ
jgi:hypothetical protein